MVDNRFKKAIAKAFYDKPFTISTRAHDKDVEGGAITTVGDPHAYLGNVQYTLNARTREAYGIAAEIDIAVTADRSVVANKDDQLEYDGVAYVVTDVKPRDSHLLIIGKR